MNSRGQFIMTTALLLAAVLVGLALVLNSVIYTENLASRSRDTATDPLLTSDEVEDAMVELIGQVNRDHNTSYDDVNRNLTDGATGWNRLAGSHFATDATRVVVSLDPADRANGTRIQQTDSARNFTAGGSQRWQGNWTLATDVAALRSFRLTVDRSDLLDVSPASTSREEAFYVQFTDGSETARVYVYTDGTNVLTRVENPAGTFTGECSVTAETATVSPTAETLGGNDCDELSLPTFGGPITVSYHNANARGGVSRSGGTYSLVVNDTTVDGTPYEAAPSSPFTSPVVYSAEVELNYRTELVSFERRARIHPGNETS